MALGQVVQRQKVDEVEVAKDVNNRAFCGQFLHCAHPGFVDLNLLEELAVYRAQCRVWLVRAGQFTFRHRHWRLRKWARGQVWAIIYLLGASGASSRWRSS